MTINSSIARLEAILNSQGPKIFCAEEQYEYLRILSVAFFLIHPVYVLIHPVYFPLGF